MKVAFVQTNPESSLGSMYIASTIEKEAECRVFIRDYEDDFYKSISKFKPDVLAYSTFSGEWKELVTINRELKKHIKSFSVFGGPHPTFYPEMIHEEGVDAICRGEGELAMLELIKGLKNEKQQIYKINNFYFKTEDGTCIKNEIRNINTQIDKLPFPDRSIYSHYFSIPNFKANICKRVISGRGCPFNCTYCFNHALKKIYHNKGNYIRIRSVQNVIEEIKFLKEKWGVSDIDFVDDIFGLNPKWLEEFSKDMRKISLSFSCLSHIRYLLDENNIQNLNRAGCKFICIGVETGDETYRKQVLRRNYKNPELYKVAKLLHKYNIAFSTLNMLLLPGENLQMATRTLQVNLRCKPFDAAVSIYQPFLGTELANYSVTNHYLEEYYNSIPRDIFTNTILKNPSKKILLRLFYLFSATVKFRFPYLLIKLLVYIPLDNFYKKIHKLYKSEIRKRYLFGLENLNKKMSLIDFIYKLFFTGDQEKPFSKSTTYKG